MFNFIKKIKKLIIGDSWDKKDYKNMIKRVKKLPKEYRYVFYKIKHYMLINGIDSYGNLDIFTDLVDLFETNALVGKDIIEVIGTDVAKFCDELIKNSDIHNEIYVKMTEKFRRNINNDIMERLNKGGK